MSFKSFDFSGCETTNGEKKNIILYMHNKLN